jgi:hypothetical protein
MPQPDRRFTSKSIGCVPLYVDIDITLCVGWLSCCRLSLLEQLLQGRLSLLQLHTHLHQAFPADAVEEALREYVDKAWQALGPTTLQVWALRRMFVAPRH